MGGIIGLTIRFLDRTEWRGSCWTNVLPEGLFAPRFYSKEHSEHHTKGWLNQILKARKYDPSLEALWGNHPHLAPVEYGLVVVDYQTDTVLSHQGYNSVISRYFDSDWGGLSPKDFAPYCELIPDPRRPDREGDSMFFRLVKSFWGFDEAPGVTEGTLQKVKSLGLKLSPQERKLWKAYLKERD